LIKINKSFALTSRWTTGVEASPRLHPLENKSERRKEQIYSLLLSLSFFTPRSYPPPHILVFSFVCRCSLTRSAIFTSPLYIRPSTFVLCRSYLLWPLLLFAGCVFVLNKSFILFSFALIDDLYDEG